MVMKALSGKGVAKGGKKCCYKDLGTATTTGNLPEITITDDASGEEFEPSLVMFHFLNANGTAKIFSVYDKYYGTGFTNRYDNTSTTAKEQIDNPQQGGQYSFIGLYSVIGSKVILNVQSGMSAMVLYAIE